MKIMRVAFASFSRAQRNTRFHSNRAFLKLSSRARSNPALPSSLRLRHVRIPSRREGPSQFPNFFDLKLGKAVSHGLLSFDGYNLGGVVRQLGVDRLTRFAG
jgi:hypothetical protein